MKKLYSLVAVAMLSTAAYSQAIFSATFDDAAGQGGNDGTWSGIQGTPAVPKSLTDAGWTFTNSYSGATCLRVGTGKNAGSVTTPAISGLNGDATLTFRAGAWDSTSESTTLNVSITGGGSLDKSSVTLTKGAFNSYTVKITGGTASSKLVFAGASGNNRFFIDDIIVSDKSLAVIGTEAAKKSFVKNTMVENNLFFGAKSDVQIISMNGQVVKSASVNDGTSLDLSGLAKGMYIVTGTVNGEKVSQKIIKK